MSVAVSIIIPALNEASALPATLNALSRLAPPPKDIILVDGGSDDQTCDLANEAGLTVLKVEQANRAAQMNAGAAAARGDRLCFLHADTLVPPDFVSAVEAGLKDTNVSLAGFVSIMRGPKRTRWLTTAHNFIKTWYAPLFFRPVLFFKGCRLLFGDQVICCRKEDFQSLGGFDPRQTIMEEADLCQRVVRAGLGRVRQINRIVYSSDRRVAEWGGLKANLIYLYIGMMWGLGVDPARLAHRYDDIR